MDHYFFSVRASKLFSWIQFHLTVCTNCDYDSHVFNVEREKERCLTLLLWHSLVLGQRQFHCLAQYTDLRKKKKIRGGDKRKGERADKQEKVFHCNIVLGQDESWNFDQTLENKSTLFKEPRNSMLLNDSIQFSSQSKANY